MNKIHEFKCGIYPRRIWITYDSSTAALQDIFGKDVEDMAQDTEACVQSVQRQKPTKLGGVLIRFRNKAAMSVQNIAHECSHAAIEISSYCDCRIHDENQEPFAYLVGWIADCCDQVKNNKFKDCYGTNQG